MILQIMLPAAMMVETVVETVLSQNFVLNVSAIAHYTLLVVFLIN